MEITFASGEAARRLGVTVKTLQRWEREGRFVPTTRTASNRRRYTERQLLDFLRQPRTGPTVRRTVAYCWVSSFAQRRDLVNQRKVLEQFTAARGLAGVEFIEEVGGGLNFGRKSSLLCWTRSAAAKSPFLFWHIGTALLVSVLNGTNTLPP